MRLFSFAALFVLAQGCENGWFSYQESCYIIIEKNEPWPFAQAFCISLGGYLVQLETPGENEFIQNYTRQPHINQSKLITSPDNFMRVHRSWRYHQRPYHYLIGGNDIVGEGNWTWAYTHEPFDYTDWAPGEPNSLKGDQDCLQIQGNQDYHWDDVECDVKHNFICETSLINGPVVGR